MRTSHPAIPKDQVGWFLYFNAVTNKWVAGRHHMDYPKVQKTCTIEQDAIDFLTAKVAEHNSLGDTESIAMNLLIIPWWTPQFAFDFINRCHESNLESL